MLEDSREAQVKQIIHHATVINDGDPWSKVIREAASDLAIEDEGIIEEAYERSSLAMEREIFRTAKLRGREGVV